MNLGGEGNTYSSQPPNLLAFYKSIKKNKSQKLKFGRLYIILYDLSLKIIIIIIIIIILLKKIIFGKKMVI